MDHWAPLDMGSQAQNVRARHSKPAEPLGGLSVILGALTEVRPKFEALVSEATYTRQVSLLWPETASGSTSSGGSSSSTSTPSPAARSFAEELLSQKYYYEVHGVKVGALGDQQFADACKTSRLVALSRSEAGFSSGNVIAVLPKGNIHIAVDELTFQRLGFEEPAPGAKRLAAKLLPSGRRHLEVAMGLSKTRIKKAGGASLATSFWRQQVGVQETCSMLAYCDRLTSTAEESSGEGGDPPTKFLSMILTSGGMVRRLAVPTSIRRLLLGSNSLPRPPLEKMVWEPAAWQAEAYGEACEDLADWIGLLSLASCSSSQTRDGGDASDDEDESGDDLSCAVNLNFDPGREGAANLWQLGEALTGPHQIKHTLEKAIKLISSNAQAPPASCPTWFVLSVHLAEEQPTSLQGGCHDFDLHGAQHLHLLVVAAPAKAKAEGEVGTESKPDEGSLGAGELRARCLLLVSSNAQQTKG